MLIFFSPDIVLAQRPTGAKTINHPISTEGGVWGLLELELAHYKEHNYLPTKKLTLCDDGFESRGLYK